MPSFAKISPHKISVFTVKRGAIKCTPIFHAFCRLLIFLKIIFSKNSFRNTIRVTNSLHPDQPQHFIGSDLGPNRLQRLSADDTSKQRVKIGMVFRKVNCVCVTFESPHSPMTVTLEWSYLKLALQVVLISGHV